MRKWISLVLVLAMLCCAATVSSKAEETTAVKTRHQIEEKTLTVSTTTIIWCGPTAMQRMLSQPILLHPSLVVNLVDEESFELRFFSREEMPSLFAEDHNAAMDAYFSGVRYPLLRENTYHPSATIFE